MKRVLDFLFSLILLAIFSPLILVVSILIRINLGSPIIFKQPRPGMQGKVFNVYKFRTMLDLKDDAGKLLADSERLTRFGSFIRKVSLDEIPQLFNVLKGDMSFVGPRPLLVRYLPYFSEEEMKRHNVRPGITGLAQINGRNSLEWDERLKLDVEYVEKCSTLLDISIIGKTIIKVLKSDNVVISPTNEMLDFDEERKNASQKDKK